MKRVLVPKYEVDSGLIDPLCAENYANRRVNKISHAVRSLGILETKDREKFSQRFVLAKPNHSREGFVPVIEGSLANEDLTYRIPNSYKHFAGPLARIATHEHNAYPHAHYSDVRITVDRDFVEKGKAQRGIDGRWHIDSWPGAWNHVYLVTDKFPTEFNTDYQAAPYEITFMNGNVEHRSTIVAEDTLRTLFRVIYRHDLSIRQSA